MVKDRLLDAIFAATDMKLKNYFENFETPEFSEEKWALLNPVEFSYSGYAEEGQVAADDDRHEIAGSDGRMPQKGRVLQPDDPGSL